jgi:hypothetical protein
VGVYAGRLLKGEKASVYINLMTLKTPKLPETLPFRSGQRGDRITRLLLSESGCGTKRTYGH